MTDASCDICNSKLRYAEPAENMTCYVCKEVSKSNIKCEHGHFICDSCNELGVLDYIEKFCVNSLSTHPIILAESIMNSSKIKIHCPEHHFLVPAVLLTAYYNIAGESSIISKKIKISRERSKNILPGFCGFYGACGAGIGTGIFLSIILNCSPFSKNEWRLCGLMTSKSLKKIAANSGPRCCKRVTYQALTTAIDFIEAHLKVYLGHSRIECSYYNKNKECIEGLCEYHSISLSS